MSLALQPGATDLYLPVAEAGEVLDPYTVHTYYFGFSVPEAGIGAYLYFRAQPAFGLSQGGPVIFRGLDNTALLDAEYHDYRATMPWPQVQGNTITTANGYVITVLEPGELIRLQYTSPDGTTSFDIEQRAISPLVARGHIVPGEEDHHAGARREPGGIEQFMHATGELTLRGERFDVDCLAVRDRSWLQVRGEEPGGARRSPPVGWTPISFGPDLSLNVTSMENKDTGPAWLGVYDVPDDAPTFYSGWIARGEETRAVVRVRRNALEYHPFQYSVTRQELEIEDDQGEVYRFTGEALAMTPMHSWPNIAFHDSLYRWTAEDGRTAHGTYQEIWWDDYQRAMAARPPLSR
ncbi:MAG: hypothetical protein JWO02_2187 [Solirubrobacterales bacterium]|nr:hypothetical protein [Solirubrobacterales bacterium]